MAFSKSKLILMRLIRLNWSKALITDQSKKLKITDLSNQGQYARFQIND